MTLFSPYHMNNEATMPPHEGGPGSSANRSRRTYTRAAEGLNGASIVLEVAEMSTPNLTAKESAHLESIAASRSVSKLRGRRAAMLLDFCGGVPLEEIARSFRTGRQELERYLERAIRQDVLEPRERNQRRHIGRAVTPQAEAWARDLSRRNPREFGYTCTQWSNWLLAGHVRDHCRAAGHDTLARLSSSDVSHLLNWPERT